MEVTGACPRCHGVKVTCMCMSFVNQGLSLYFEAAPTGRIHKLKQRNREIPGHLGLLLTGILAWYRFNLEMFASCAGFNPDTHNQNNTVLFFYFIIYFALLDFQLLDFFRNAFLNTFFKQSISLPTAVCTKTIQAHFVVQLHVHFLPLTYRGCYETIIFSFLESI